MAPMSRRLRVCALVALLAASALIGCTGPGDSWTPAGGGFSSPRTCYAIAFSLLPLPPYTFMMATYDMSLAGLAFSSLAMIAMHLGFDRHHWILPRRWMTWLQSPSSSATNCSARTHFISMVSSRVFIPSNWGGMIQEQTWGRLSELSNEDDERLVRPARREGNSAMLVIVPTD